MEGLYGITHVQDSDSFRFLTCEITEDLSRSFLDLCF